MARMIATAKATSRGRIVLPKRVRQHMGIHPEDRVRFVVRDKAVVIEKVALGAPAEDPFVTFVEWNSEADRRAYDNL